jgi:hypothetical protein
MPWRTKVIGVSSPSCCAGISRMHTGALGAGVAVVGGADVGVIVGLALVAAKEKVASLPLEPGA